MSALGQATAIIALTRSLAEGLRTGDALVSDARKLEQLLREAEHWLHEAHRFLDPAVDRKAAPMADEPALTAERAALPWVYGHGRAKHLLDPSRGGVTALCGVEGANPLDAPDHPPCKKCLKKAMQIGDLAVLNGGQEASDGAA